MGSGVRFITSDASTPRSRLALYIDVFGGWRWEYFDERGEARDSRESFDSRHDCFIDAQRNGLVAPERTRVAQRGSTPTAPGRRAAGESTSEPSSAGARASIRAAA